MTDTDKQELAEERTDWAEDRTVLANERTFAGWMRTGMGSLAIAVGLQAVFGATEPTWVAKATASIFVVVALCIFYAAWNNSKRMLQRLESHTAEPVSGRHMGVVAALLASGSVVAGIVLWLV